MALVLRFCRNRKRILSATIIVDGALVVVILVVVFIMDVNIVEVDIFAVIIV